MRFAKHVVMLLLAVCVFGYGIAVGRFNVFPFRQMQVGWGVAQNAGDRLTALVSPFLPSRDPSPSGDAIPIGASGFSPISTETLRALPTRGWLTNGGNLFNQRYSPLDQINRSNVSNLGAAWRTHLDGSGMGPGYSGEAQPLVHDGVIYVVSAADDVFAISVDTGRILWRHRAQLEWPNHAICCGSTSRGVGLGDGRVYLGQVDGKLVALDQHSGAVVWSVQAERSQEGYTITSAPLYYDGLIVTGFAGAEHATRGRVKAFDAKTGALVWTFYTIPGPGEFGSDTWPANDNGWMFGGGSVWQTPAVDPSLGLLYFQTANPNPDMNGGVRAGDNLFTSSVVALEAATGRYRWHFQMVHHDLWDYDGANPVILFDAEVAGRTRQGLAAAGKTGWVYILDRTNGRPLLGIEERAVPQEPRQSTARTQPYPFGDAFVPQQIEIAPEGMQLINQGRIFTPYWTAPVVFKPGTQGGANWPPSSYDPQTHMMYICATDQSEFLVATETVNLTPALGEKRIGGSFGPPLLPRGVFAAIDLRTNRLRWQQHWAEPCYSGSVTTAGGLVFVGRNDGRLTALNSHDGARLWSFQTGAGVNAPASVFEHRGKEFVVVLSAGNALARTTTGDSVWLFSLDGTLGPVASSAQRAVAVAADAVSPDAQDSGTDLVAGERVYTQACIVCHGGKGEGGHTGTPLTAATDVGNIRRTVAEGRNQMPPFATILTPSEIRAVAGYVSTRLPH